jgi:hypothetical protein
MSNVVLIHPPSAKACEPPAGVARLAAAIKGGGISCSVIDANLEAQLRLLGRDPGQPDGWTRIARRNSERHLAEIRSGAAFKTVHHYNRVVNDLNRLLGGHGARTGHALTLADCTHPEWSPTRSGDLLRCAEHPEADPFFGYFDSELMPEIERIGPETVGLSVNFMSQALSAFRLAGLIRKRLPGVKLVLGGGLVTSWMNAPGWNEPFRGLADRCVKGPGEAFFIPGWNSAEDAVRRPAPAFGGQGMEGYLSPGFILPYDASVGCYWRRCRFCPETAEKNPCVRIPEDRVTADLAALAGSRRPALIHFLDNALAPALLDRIVENPPGFPWYGYVRITEKLADPEHCRKLKASGCALLKLGVESGDQAVLDAMDKGFRVETASKALRALERAGIKTYVYLLFGTPAETEDAAERTLDFTVRHASSIGFLNAAIFNLPALSPDASGLVTRPFSEGDLSLYLDFEHPKGWDRSRVRRFLDRVFRRDPVVAGIMARTPRTFTSNHAAFFTDVPADKPKH